MKAYLEKKGLTFDRRNIFWQGNQGRFYLFKKRGVQTQDKKGGECSNYMLNALIGQEKSQPPDPLPFPQLNPPMGLN